MNIRSNPDTTLPAVTTGPLPASRKIHLPGEHHAELRVAMREIDLTPSSGEPPVRVYDTSGPYTDPTVVIDVNAGLPRIRTAWVKERGGVEEYQGRDIKPEDNGNVGASHAAKTFTAHHTPLRGVDGHKITQLEFARAGIITKEMIYVAERENLGRQQQLEDQAGERERAEVVGGQGGLEAVHGAAVSRIRPAGVVNQQIKARVLGAQRRGFFHVDC